LPSDSAIRVAFRADASPLIGSGHVVRCLTLADALRKRGVTATIITRAFSPGGVELAQARGYTVRALPTERGHEASWLGAGMAEELASAGTHLAQLAPLDWIVTDHYALDAHWERAARAHAARVLVIDDLADRAHDCDVLVDATWLPPGSPDRYGGLIPAHATRLEGPRYALLREEFTRQPRRVRDGPLRRLLVFFGGADPDDVTSLALDGIERAVPRAVEIDVVVGPANGRAAVLGARWGGRARVHVDTDRMAELMAGADLAVGAGGTTSWERAWLGLPAVIVSIAENQREIARGLAQAGAVIDLGPHERVDPAAFAAAVHALVDDPVRLRAMSRAALAVMGPGETLGTARVVDTMLRLGRGAAA